MKSRFATEAQGNSEMAYSSVPIYKPEQIKLFLRLTFPSEHNARTIIGFKLSLKFYTLTEPHEPKSTQD